MTDTDSPFTHQTCLYGSDGEFLSMAVPFTREGLTRGEAVLAVTTPGNIALLRGALGEDASRVDFADAYSWYRYPATTLAAYNRYVQRQAGRSGRVRIIGEPIWAGRSDRETVEWKRYESTLNVAFAALPAWAVCAYDTRILPGSIVADAQRTHPVRVAGPQARPCLGYVHPAQFVQAFTAEPLPTVPDDAAALPFVGDLHGARRFLTAEAARLGGTGEWLMTWVAAVDEAVTYVMRQGSGHAAIRVWAEGADIVCDIHDPAGRLDDPFAGYLPPSVGPVPGDGLWLTRQVCEVVELRSGLSGCAFRIQKLRKAAMLTEYVDRDRRIVPVEG